MIFQENLSQSHITVYLLRNVCPFLKENGGLWERAEVGRTGRNEVRGNIGWDVLYEGRKYVKKKKVCLLSPKQYVYSHIVSL